MHLRPDRLPQNPDASGGHKNLASEPSESSPPAPPKKRRRRRGRGDDEGSILPPPARPPPSPQFWNWMKTQASGKKAPWAGPPQREFAALPPPPEPSLPPSTPAKPSPPLSTQPQSPAPRCPYRRRPTANPVKRPIPPPASETAADHQGYQAFREVWGAAAAMLAGGAAGRLHRPDPASSTTSFADTVNPDCRDTEGAARNHNVH